MVLYQNTNLFTLMELADDFYINPGNGCELSRPIGPVVRPGDPGGLMGLPFSRHSKAWGCFRGWQRNVLAAVDSNLRDRGEWSVDQPMDYATITINTAA